MGTADTTPRAEADDDGFAEALARYARAMDRLLSGDPEPIKALSAHGAETSLCGLWGGVARGWAEVGARWDWAAAQFVPGERTHTQEVILTSVTAEMAYAVFVERAQVHIVGQPEPRLMAVRVTAVFRREADGWKAVHRHGDGLVEPTR